MAFEYLIATFLLRQDTDAVMEYLGDFRKFGYNKLPRAVQEALLIPISNGKKPNMYGYDIDRSILASFNEFSSLMMRNNNSNSLQKFQASYWFYILYISPYASKK